MENARKQPISDYGEFQQLLLQRRRELLGQADHEKALLDEQVQTDPGDVADASVIDTSADYFMKLHDTHRHELLEIQAALDRIATGTYGVCESCGTEISPARLRRLPTARLCIDDQSAAEKNERRVRIQPMPKL